MPVLTSRQIVGVLLLAGACLNALAARVDCAKDVQAPLSIEVVNRSGKQDEELVRKLETAACKASYGAMKEAASRGKHPEWIQGLLFVIVDDISGNKLQASFQRRFGGAPSRWVDVTEPLLSTAPANQLVWTLGHELAHGVLKHQEVKKAISVGGTTAALVGGMGAVAANKFTHKIAAGVVGAGGAAAWACGAAAMSPRQEIAADLFGVKVLEQTGLTLAAAKDIALTLIKSHPDEAETCWGKNGVNSNPHPATQTRVDAINALS